MRVQQLNRTMSFNATAKLDFSGGNPVLTIAGTYEFSREDDEIVMKKSHMVSVHPDVLFIDISIKRGTSSIRSVTKSFEVKLNGAEYERYNKVAFFRLGFPYQVEITR